MSFEAVIHPEAERVEQVALLAERQAKEAFWMHFGPGDMICPLVKRRNVSEFIFQYDFQP